MNALIFIAIASLAAPALSSYAPVGAVVEGPSGIVTDKGVPIGPTGPAGKLAPLAYAAAPLAYAAPAPFAYAAPAPLAYAAPAPLLTKTILTPPVASAIISPAPLPAPLIAPAPILAPAPIAAPSLLVKPAPEAYGYGVPISGVAVKGPGTVPATIAGPSGKIYAEGLWGPTLAVGKKYY